MRNEFTAVIESADEWFIAYYREIPGANGQGKAINESMKVSRTQSRQYLKIA